MYLFFLAQRYWYGVAPFLNMWNLFVLNWLVIVASFILQTWVYRKLRKGVSHESSCGLHLLDMQFPSGRQECLLLLIHIPLTVVLVSLPCNSFNIKELHLWLSWITGSTSLVFVWSIAGFFSICNIRKLSYRVFGYGCRIWKLLSICSTCSFFPWCGNAKSWGWGIDCSNQIHPCCTNAAADLFIISFYHYWLKDWLDDTDSSSFHGASTCTRQMWRPSPLSPVDKSSLDPLTRIHVKHCLPTQLSERMGWSWATRVTSGFHQKNDAHR